MKRWIGLVITISEDAVQLTTNYVLDLGWEYICTRAIVVTLDMTKKLTWYTLLVAQCYELVDAVYVLLIILDEHHDAVLLVWKFKERHEKRLERKLGEWVDQDCLI